MTLVWLGTGLWLLAVIAWRLSVGNAQVDEAKSQLPQSTVQPDVPAVVSRIGHPEPGAADNTPN